MIFIASISGSKCLTFITYRFFHQFRDWRLMENLAPFSAKEVKGAKAEEEKSISLRVEVKGKIIPTNFLSIDGKGTFVGPKYRRKRDS